MPNLGHNLRDREREISWEYGLIGGVITLKRTYRRGLKNVGKEAYFGEKLRPFFHEENIDFFQLGGPISCQGCEGSKIDLVTLILP